tara:strand:+ start:5828 stop:7108 length:1281 start_codon:yes stop_codon:yes gene_type:complete
VRILILIIYLFSFNLFAQDFSVRVEDLQNIKAYSSNISSTNMEIISVAPSSSGLGNEEANPILSFMAMDGNDSQSNFFIGKNYDQNSTLLPKLDLTQAYFFIDLEVKNFTTVQKVINVAVKKDDEYISFKLINTSASLTVDASTEVNIQLGFSLDDLCAESAGEYSICIGDTTIKEDLSVYFYLSDNNDEGTEVVTSSDGLFLELKLSNTLPENNFIVDRADSGDARVFLTVSNGDEVTQMGDDFFETAVFKYSDAVERVTSAPVNASYFFSFDQAELKDSGEYIINNLENGTAVNLAISKINKYLFSSNLSNSKVETPLEVEVFLKKSSCYILSAGFSRDHYIVEFFRSFRDEMLLRSIIGKKFVEFYYRTSPMYTGVILKSRPLQLVIRALAHAGYFVFKYFAVIIILFSGLYLYKARRNYGRS